MSTPAAGILAMFLLACALLGPMLLLRRRAEHFMDRLEAHVRSLGNPAPGRNPLSPLQSGRSAHGPE